MVKSAEELDKKRDSDPAKWKWRRMLLLMLKNFRNKHKVPINHNEDD